MKYMRVKTDAQGTMDEVRVAEADKLSTGRYISVSLSNESNEAFDGSANISIGTQGTLPVKKGGTGATDLSNVTVGTAEKVANALTVTVNGEETAYDGSAAAAVTVSASNPNLLYNSDFAINQRGSFSYTSTGYTVDGWRKPISAGTVSWNINGVKPSYTSLSFPTSGSTYHIRQYIENFLRRDGTHYTVTIGYATSETSATVVGTHTFNVTSTTATQTYTYDFYTGYTITLFLYTRSSSSHDYLAIQRASSATTTLYIRYIKLEEGDVATPYEIPDPATELLKCQRYYINYTARCELMGSIYGSANRAGAGVWLPCPMRVKPTLVSEDTDNVHVDGGYVPISANGISIQHMSGNYLYMYLTLDQNKRRYDPTAAQFIHFELSAELTS